MRTDRLTTLPVLLLAAGAIVVGLALPAAARETSQLINGSSIKAHSVTGSKLVNNTVTGKQIKESTLGTVPKAKTAITAEKLPPLVWHKITTYENGWSAYTAGEPSVAWAVDAQGIVHLRGALTGGTVEEAAFALPASIAPAGQTIYLADLSYNDSAGVVVVGSGELSLQSGNKLFFGLDGLTFSPA